MMNYTFISILSFISALLIVPSHAALNVGPPGQVFAFAAATCPAHSVLSDGSSVLRAGKYSQLFTVIGTTWGSADGTHFTLPPLSGRILKGAGSITDGNGGTSTTLGAYQADTTAKNGLSITDPGHIHGQGINTGGSGNNNYPGSIPGGGPNFPGNTSSSSTGITLNTGDTETRPKTYGVYWCIWY